MSALLYCAVWILIGSWGAATVDGHEMSQAVPYGDAPSALSLLTVRILLYAFSVFIGPLYMLLFAVLFVWNVTYIRYRVWRRFRRKT